MRFAEIKVRTSCLVSSILLHLLCAALGMADTISAAPSDNLAAIYAASGESGVREHALARKKSLDAADIIKLALDGVEKRNGDLLAVARILAEMGGDRRVLADVYVQMARFGLAVSDQALIASALDKSLHIYRELHIPVGEANVHRLRGDALVKRGDKTGALDRYRAALELYAAVENQPEQGNMHRNIGELLAGAGDAAGALEHYRSAAGRYERAGFHLGAGNVSQMMGELHLRQGNIDAAQAAFEAARAFYDKAGNRLGQGNSWYRSGEIEVRKKRYPEALDDFTRALRFYEMAENHDAAVNVRQSLANLHGLQGDVLSRAGELRAALEEYRKGIALLGQEGKISDSAPFYRNIADTLLKLQEPAQAADNYAMALAGYEKSGNAAAVAVLHRKLGDLYQQQGSSTDAVKSYEAAYAWYDEKGDRAHAALMYRLAGTASRKGNDPGRARTYYEKSLALLEPGGNSQEIAELCLLAGELAMEGGDAAQARSLYGKGLMRLGNAGSPRIRGYLVRNLAQLYAVEGEVESALDYMDKAFQSFVVAGDPFEQGSMLLATGDLQLKRGENLKAVDIFARARTLFRGAGNDVGQGYALRGEGEAYYLSGNPARAKECFTDALALFAKAGDHKGQGATSRNLGDLAMLEGAHAAALESYGAALAFYSKVGDIQGIGDCYRSQADVYARMGDMPRAIEFQAKTRALLAKSGDILGKAHELRSQGDIYLKSGNNSRAMALYGEAMALYRKAGDLSAQGNVTRIIGNVYFQAGEYGRALEEYDRALPILEKTGDLPGQGNVYQSRGDIAYVKGEYTSALNLYARALQLFEKSSDRLGQANIFKSQADVYAMQRDSNNAMRLYRSALDFYVRSGDTESQAYTILGMAKAASLESTPESALRLYIEGIGLLERVRTQSTLIQLKKGFLDKVYDFYDEAAVFMLNNKLPDEAFRVAESMKARVFIDQLTEGNVNLEQGGDPQLKAREAALETRITALKKQLSEMNADPQNNQLTASFRQSLGQAENELNEIHIRFRLSNPMYGAVRYPEPVSLKKIREEILGPKETLLEYFVSGENVYCFVVTREAVFTHTLPLLRKDLERHIAELIESVKTGPTRNPKKLEAVSKTLYDSLVRPLQQHLGKQSVILVPDGILARVPFEMLIRQEADGSRYFIENNDLKYFQSATFLALQRTVLKKTARSSSFIGFGDPVYDYPAFSAKRPEFVGSSVEASAAAGSPLARLEASGREVTAIKEIFEARKLPARALLREEAREEYAKAQELKEYGFIHFAAHGIMDARQQAIALSRIPGSAGDGYLTIGEIMKSNYSMARLVVLSACQSGLGELDRGEGITGLTRAVMYAGSPTAVVSLWNISDTATKALMEKMYDNIITHSQPLAEGLRSAKLDMIRQGNFRHPLFWGAFVMYGE